MGGLVAAEAARGTRIDLFCSTDGDAGKSSGIPVSSREELAALRRNELHEAARILGIRSVTRAGHPDGALGGVEQEPFIGEIGRFLRAVKPQVVITFGPEGAPTGHRDHKAISRAATAAYFLAGVETAYPDAGPAHAPSRLFYVTWDPPQPDAELQLHGLPVHLRIDIRPWHDTMRRAFHAHATQRMHEARFTELALTADECLFLASSAVNGVLDGLWGSL